MTICVDIQQASEDPCPDPEQIRRWVEQALAGKDAEVSLRIVDEAEMTTLNHRYRGKQGPTNVLSFPFDPPPGVPTDFLGDIVICSSVVAKEAREQGKSLSAHWAHMVVHGLLHLQGYDHIDPKDALAMEQLEMKILARLGYDNPYQEEVLTHHE